MIHSIRKLAREIHRRSVWQILGAFVVFSVVVLEVVTLLTRYIGLPWWTPTMAMILLAVGLPIVVATAVVQSGLPFLRIKDVADPNELPGRTPSEVHVVPEAHPLYGVGVLTWRNTALGGVAAAALLVTSVVAYLSMWTLGIGPVGSLIAQGVLAENDTIIVADFENRTDHAELGERVREALSVQLARSGIVTVLADPEMSRALGRVSQDVGRVSQDVGRAVLDDIRLALEGRREIKAFIAGEVSLVEDVYRVGARIVLPNGATLASFRETTPDLEGIDPGMALLSARIRQRIGESLRVVQAERARVEREGS